MRSSQFIKKGKNGKFVSARIEGDEPKVLYPFRIGNHLFKVEKFPYKGCNKCHGGGSIGKRKSDLRPVLCKCIGYHKHVHGPLKQNA